MPIVPAQTCNAREREDLACTTVEEHVNRVVVCTPTRIVFEVKGFGDSLLASKKLSQHGFSSQPHEQGGVHFLHVVL